MATRPIVPRANGEGSLGVDGANPKYWGAVYTEQLNGAEAQAMADRSVATLRTKNTAYVSGTKVVAGRLPINYILMCTGSGTTANADITLPATITDGATFTDGTATWQIQELVTTQVFAFRQPSTAVTAASIVFCPGLPSGFYLECKTAGTTGSGAITLPAQIVENAEVTDDTVTWTIRKIGSGGGEAVGVIKAYAGNGDIPSGYLLCDGSAVSRTMFPDLFATIGTTYGSGDGSTTFNLPDYNTAARFAQGGTVAGTVKQAGLPNITGSQSGVLTTNQSPAQSGALIKNNGTLAKLAITGTSFAYNTISLDASASNPIYGNSDTVQPNALTCRYIIKAFDGQTADSALIDITQYENALNQKVDKVTFNDLFRDTAAAHNCFYRGKDLTEYWDSGEMSAAIADGSFRDIYPGDYIIKTVTINSTTYADQKFIVMDLDYFQPWSFDGTDTHHIVMMPEGALGTQYMNSTNITTGGYVGSYMHVTHIPKVNTGIVAAFGSAHVLSHQEQLTNAVDTSKPSGAGSGYTGCATGWTAVSNLKCCLCSENMVYGGRVWGSAMDTGCASKQLAAFRHNQQLRKTTSFWLRAVSISTDFASASLAGFAASYYASGAHGVRPYFLLA